MDLVNDLVNGMVFDDILLQFVYVLVIHVDLNVTNLRKIFANMFDFTILVISVNHCLIIMMTRVLDWKISENQASQA